MALMEYEVVGEDSEPIQHSVISSAPFVVNSFYFRVIECSSLSQRSSSFSY